MKVTESLQCESVQSSCHPPPAVFLIKNRLSLHYLCESISLHCRLHSNEGQLNLGLILQCSISLSKLVHIHMYTVTFPTFCHYDLLLISSFYLLHFYFFPKHFSHFLYHLSPLTISTPLLPFPPSLFSPTIAPSTETNFPSIITVLYDLV